MKIICDTNIWYNISMGEIEEKSIPKNVCATFNNIDELARSEKLINENSTIVVNALKRIISKKQFILVPPFHYLIETHTKEYKYDFNNIDALLRFTEQIAKGNSIPNDKNDFFLNYSNTRKEGLILAAKYYEAMIIKMNAKHPNKNNKIKSINTRYLRMFIISETKKILNNSDGLLKNFNWNNVELFEGVLNEYFHQIKESGRKIDCNDFFDLSQLLYVSKADLIWTKDKKLLNLIKEAKLEKYIFEEISLTH